MKNGTVILTIDKSDTWYVKLVLWFIRKASGFPHTHTQVWIDGYIWETRHPDGFCKTKRTPTPAENRVLLEPVRDLTKEESEGMKAFFEDKIRNNIPYNYPKLFLSFFLYWSRPFWEKIKWIPFQDDKVWGNHCSSGVDEAFMFVGIDVLPDGYEEITTPGDFTKSEFFKEI